MQNFNTDDMAHKIPRCIEWVTSIHTLQPGDILATGTNHRGLNPFMDGDKIELTSEGCGTLHITVRDDLKRTWSLACSTNKAERKVCTPSRPAANTRRRSEIGGCPLLPRAAGVLA